METYISDELKSNKVVAANIPVVTEKVDVHRLGNETVDKVGSGQRHYQQIQALLKFNVLKNHYSDKNVHNAARDAQYTVDNTKRNGPC